MRPLKILNMTMCDRPATARAHAAKMFTYIKFEDGVKAIVNTDDIVDFNVQNVQFDKKYQVNWDDGHFCYGILGKMQQKIILEETKEAVDKKIRSRSIEFLPFSQCISTVDTESDRGDVIGTKINKNENNISCLKRKRYNKFFLDKNNRIPLVTNQTWKRWQNYSKDKNGRSKNISKYPFSTFKTNIETSHINRTSSYTTHEIGEQILVSQETDDRSNCYEHNEDAKIDSVENFDQSKSENEEIETDNSTCEISDTDDVTITNDANMKRNIIMFESSKTTVDEVVQMIHTYCVRFNCSDEARLALFNMATTWAGPNFSTFMNSKYMKQAFRSSRRIKSICILLYRVL